MTLVRMRLELPGIREAVEVEGVVVRTVKLRDKTPATYDVALFFSQLTPNARQTVEGFVRTNLVAQATL